MSYLCLWFPCLAARPTVPSAASGIDVGVCCAVRVALWTLRLGRLVSTAALASLPAPHIRAMRNRFKMLRVDTSGVSAKVIQVHLGRDGAAEQFIADPVRGNGARAIPEISVPQRRASSIPLPAFAGLASIELRPEPFFQSLGGASKSACLGVVFHTVIVAGAA